MAERASQLLRGTLDVLILKTLSREPLHGYAVVANIAAETGGVLEIEDGALYQSLHRMEERGFVESAWGHADSGKRAKFYRLTPDGHRQLRVDTESWLRYAEAVFKILRPASA